MHYLTCAHTCMDSLFRPKAPAARTAGLPPPAAAEAASGAGAPSLGAPRLLPASESNAAASRDCMSGSRPATASVCCCECCSWRHQSFACTSGREWGLLPRDAQTASLRTGGTAGATW